MKPLPIIVSLTVTKPPSAMYAESPTAFECLYRAHHDWLRHWLCRKLECSERAADLTHDTFLRLLTRQAHVAGEAPRALLVTIAKGLVVDHWRRFALEKAYLDAQATLPDTYAPAPEAQHEALQTLEQLVALLEGLKPKVRDAFLLYQLGGLSHAQIAARLQVSRRTTERYVASALLHCYQLRFEND